MKGDASMGTETHVEPQFTLTLSQLTKLGQAIFQGETGQITDDPVVNYVVDCLMMQQIGQPVWPYNEKTYLAEIEARGRATCSDECKAQVDKPATADDKWHTLACPNHTIACCPGLRDD